MTALTRCYGVVEKINNSRDIVVMGGGSCSVEVWIPATDTRWLIFLEKFHRCLKRPKINKKRPRMSHLAQVVSCFIFKSKKLIRMELFQICLTVGLFLLFISSYVQKSPMALKMTSQDLHSSDSTRAVSWTNVSFWFENVVRIFLKRFGR